MRVPARLLALLLLAASTARAQSMGGDALRARFAPQEQWMLDAILSDDAQDAAFHGEAAKAKSEAEARAFELRWRKKAIAFAEQYHRVLETTDIIPNADSVEKMVSPYEFAVENYWFARQPKEKQEEFKKSIAEGNAVLGLMRGTVEKRVREGRKKAADEIERYIESPPVRDALAWHEEAPPAPSKPAPAKPDPSRPAPGTVAGGPAPVKPPMPGPAKPAQQPGGALGQLEGIAAQHPDQSPTAEGAHQGADSGYSGGAGSGVVDAGSASPVPPPASDAGPAGGFRVKPPLVSVISHDNVPKVSATGVIIKRLLPPGLGLVAGAVAGALLFGLLGALIGALAGAAAGYFIGKALNG